MTLSNQKRLPLACIGSLAVAMAAAVGCSSGPDVVMVGSAPEVEGEAPPVGRQSARMTVDQLNRSLTAVAGTDAAGDPIQWGFSNVYDFSDLGPILGDPNYIRVTEEPAIPNALYVKFMRDVASNVCGQMRDADAAKTPQDRVLLRFSDAAGQQSEADVEDNIRYLHLRFFGERIAEDDAETMEAIRAVFQTATEQAKAVGAQGEEASLEGWTAVCVALMTSPSFHIY